MSDHNKSIHISEKQPAKPSSSVCLIVKNEEKTD